MHGAGRVRIEFLILDKNSCYCFSHYEMMEGKVLVFNICEASMNNKTKKVLLEKENWKIMQTLTKYEEGTSLEKL